VAVVRQAFLDADCGESTDGTITVDASRLETAFDAAAVAMGFDPTQLTVPRSTVTVDDPVAAGVFPSRPHGFGVDVERQYVSPGARGEDSVDPAAGAHVEHAVVGAGVIEDGLAEQDEAGRYHLPT
jgi:hypothetical protein